MIDELSHLYCRVIHQIRAVKTQPVRKPIKYFIFIKFKATIVYNI